MILRFDLIREKDQITGNFARKMSKINAKFALNVLKIRSKKKIEKNKSITEHSVHNLILILVIKKHIFIVFTSFGKWIPLENVKNDFLLIDRFETKANLKLNWMASKRNLLVKKREHTEKYINKSKIFMY